MPTQEPRPSNEPPFASVPPPPPMPAPVMRAEAPQPFCRNCGRSVHPSAIACPGCGLAPLAGTGFCNYCGAQTRPGQIACLTCGGALQTQTSGPKNKTTAGLLAIFLGALGIHKFYLGYNKAGAIMLAVCIVGAFFYLGPLAAWVVGLIEGITYLSKSDAEFAATYVNGKREWF